MKQQLAQGTTLGRWHILRPPHSPGKRLRGRESVKRCQPLVEMISCDVKGGTSFFRSAVFVVAHVRRIAMPCSQVHGVFLLRCENRGPIFRRVVLTVCLLSQLHQGLSVRYPQGDAVSNLLGYASF